MVFYFLLIRIAALFGHKKARALVQGQKATLAKEQKEQLESLRGAIWFHAASVGEFEQARPLIERLRPSSPVRSETASAVRTPSAVRPIVVTFFSPSGYDARKNYELADGVYYLPFATRRNVRKFLDALQPKMALFIKYEFWPAYLRELKKREIPTYSLCSIFRPEQVFFRWYGKGQLKLLHCFTQLYVQDENSRSLLAEHGVHDVTVVGDTRFDRVRETAGANRPSATDRPGTMSPDRIQITDRLSPVAEFVEGCERVIVAGSTWPEDEVLLQQYIGHCSLDIGDCKTKLILVPHEIDEEHLHFIFNLFQGRYAKYSEMENGQWTMDNRQTCRQNILRKADVLVIDTMGLLSSIYRFGQAAYIGGGFGVGIHNTIEAAAYGMPVIFGPNYHTFREAQGLIDAGAGRSIANYEELEAAIETALNQHATIGSKAAAYVESELGATEKIFGKIFS